MRNFLGMDEVYDDTLLDFTCNFDESCMMDEPEGWSVLQTLLQNILEVFSKLEVSIDKCYQEVSQKNSSEEKQDLSKAERLLQTLKSSWLAKCKETENLRVALNQSTDESVRVNNEYNQMKDTISNMRKQFGDAVDSSVSDIEELSIVNSNLSQRIAELEAKIEGAEKYFKRNVKGSLTTLLHGISTCRNGAPAHLRTEVEKLSHLVNVENLFSSKLIESNTSLTQKGKNVLEKVTLGLNESLNLEVNESRKIIDNLQTRIKDVEREKSELSEVSKGLQDDMGKEVNNIVEYFNTFITNNSNINTGIDTFNSHERSIQIIKRLLGNFNDNFNKLYEKSTNKCNELNDLNETISYLNEQLKTALQRSEYLEDENHILKKQSEQTDINYRCGIEELDIIQSKLRRIEEERDFYFDENKELRGEKVGIHGHYDNLDDENEKLIQKIKKIEIEKDKLYNDLEEQIKKTNQHSTDRKSFEYKCEELEHTITKLKREYTNITREMNMLTQENEELKKSVQDSERDCIILKRNMKSIEMNNKDLEDQISHLTRQNQKAKSDYEKLKSNIHEYNTMIKELEYKSTTCEHEKLNLESDLKRNRIEKLDLEESNRDLMSQLSLKEELSDKTKVILSGYEKLLIKLLCQRKEIIFVTRLDQDQQYSSSWKLSSSQSMQYKRSSEIEENLKKTSSDIDSSFNSITLFLKSSEDNWKTIERYYQDLTRCMDTSHDPDKDSCYYSTDGEVIEQSRSSTKNDNKTNFSSHTTRINNTNRLGNIQILVNKIKGSAKHVNIVDEKLIVMKRKSKKSIKIIRQLQLRLRHQKSLENNKRSKILHLSKRLKHIRAHHHAHHKKHYNDAFDYHGDGDVTTSPIHRFMPLERPYVILNELSENLANTEGVLDEALHSVNESSNNVNERIIDEFTKLKSCLSTSRQILLNKVPGDHRKKSDPSSVETTKSDPQEQRQYMIEHIKYTNKRLEVLLNCWKGKDEIKAGGNDYNNNYTGSLLKRVRDSYKSDEDIMRRAVDVLELTKAISMTELDEIQENKAMDEEHLEVIILIKKMNENVENVLREARAQASERNNKSESTFTLVGSEDNIASPDPTVAFALVKRSGVHTSPSKTPFKSDTLKRESKLKLVLESTQKRVGDLSEYLKQREEELKERDEIIAKLYKEYEELKLKAVKEGTDTQNTTSDRIAIEYAKAKTRLEKENEFLQLVVKEVREELLSLQKGCKKEEESEMYLHELVNELQMSKLSLEQSLDKMASELNIVKRDKEYLMQSLQLAGFASLYQDPCYGAPYSPAASLRNNFQRMYDCQYYADCMYCAQNSESSVLPFSDEEWVSAVSCDDCDSVISDQENIDVVSSSESQSATCSRLAKNIKTAEATEKIRSKNRSARYLQKETRTRKPFSSPKKSPTNTYENSNASDTSSMTNISLTSKDSRVLGRRESNMRTRSQGSSLQTSTSRYSMGTSASVTSQESSASSPCSLRLTNSRTDLSSLHECTMLDQDDTWNEADVSPFLNPKFDGRKRKKKFLQFGKK